MFVYAWREASSTARALATTLGARRIKHENSRFRGNANKVVINYGSSSVPDEVAKCRVINRPELISTCSNKLAFFQRMSQVTDSPRVPEWTTDPEQVGRWLVDDNVVMARTVLQGHSGEGIVVLTIDDEPVQAPLYTLYKKKKDEYRVHIVGNNVIDFARKARRTDVPDDEVDWLVRNHDNGFIYARSDVTLPEDVRVQALKAMAASGLDYGAVDVIFNQHEQQAYVLEINTAPGMEGQTLTSYADALTEFTRR
jgi:glutathione synthase/RimK-type ligase-like ATP-grasp enzyme